MMMVLALGQYADAAAQKHRHTPQTTVVADTNQLAQPVDTAGIEAFSDTTDTAGVQSVTVYTNKDWDDIDDYEGFFKMVDNLDWVAVTPFLFVLGILFIIFVLCPVCILLLVFWFVRKNRKDKMRMAEMAMKNGQPIPQELLESNRAMDNGRADGNDDLWQKGMRQTFLGIGLMFFLGYTAGNIGFGIGMLVTCLGVGKLVIVKTSRNKNRVADDENLGV